MHVNIPSHLNMRSTFPHLIQSHIIDGRLWIAMAPPSANVVSIVVVDFASPTAAESRQTILGEGLVGGLYMFEAAAELYLVVGAKDPDGAGSVHARSRYLSRIQMRSLTRDLVSQDYGMICLQCIT